MLAGDKAQPGALVCQRLGGGENSEVALAAGLGCHCSARQRWQLSHLRWADLASLDLLQAIVVIKPEAIRQGPQTTENRRVLVFPLVL